jgi:hypothetical protein
MSNFTPIAYGEDATSGGLNSRLWELSNAVDKVILCGDTFPVSPAEGDRFYRSDLYRLYAYANGMWRPLRAALDRLDATAPPTVDDDQTVGYEPGSLWLDTTTGELYVCYDPGTGAAVWKRLLNARDDPATLASGIVQEAGGTGEVDCLRFTIPAGRLANLTYLKFEATISYTHNTGQGDIRLYLGATLIYTLTLTATESVEIGGAVAADGSTAAQVITIREQGDGATTFDITVQTGAVDMSLAQDFALTMQRSDAASFVRCRHAGLAGYYGS